MPNRPNETLIASENILAEFEEVLRRPRLKIASARIERVLSTIRKTSTIVRSTRTLATSRDESDNRFYECAEAGKADYLITCGLNVFFLNAVIRVPARDSWSGTCTVTTTAKKPHHIPRRNTVRFSQNRFTACR